MATTPNDRETGARIPREQTEDETSREFSKDAAKNRKPAGGMGLTESVDEVNSKTRHYDNRSTDESVAPAPAVPRKD